MAMSLWRHFSGPPACENFNEDFQPLGKLFFPETSGKGEIFRTPAASMLSMMMMMMLYC